METVRILSYSSFPRAFKKFSDNEKLEIHAAVARLPEIIGHPHQHSGAGVRRLCPSVFEIRAGLKIRVLFTISKGDIVLHTVGNHDHIKKFLHENF